MLLILWNFGQLPLLPIACIVAKKTSLDQLVNFVFKSIVSTKFCLIDKSVAGICMLKNTHSDYEFVQFTLWIMHFEVMLFSAMFMIAYYSC